MFQKMKKSKGFTLIEMLVVIAIIAVLVAIIIPTVTSATGKAKAAADAANLRSIKAEATTDYLNGQTDSTGMLSYDATAKTFTSNGATAGVPECKSIDDATLYVTVANDKITVSFNGFTINDFATVAEKGGSLPATGSAADIHK